MIFLLSKLLILVLKPLVWVFSILVITIFTKNSLKRKRLLIVAFITLFIFSNNAIVNFALSSYEPAYENYQTYDVGIVLGGFAGINDKNGEPEFHKSSDRIMQAIYLFRRGVIKKILISAGNINQVDVDKREANVVAKYLREIGIPDSNIIIENQSRNTIENAFNSLKMMTKIKPEAKILVISSALHIPRAKLIFSSLSSKPIAYYPTDYRGNKIKSLPDFFIPNSDALLSWELLLKEWIGLIVDRFRVNYSN